MPDNESLRLGDAEITAPDEADLEVGLRAAELGKHYAGDLVKEACLAVARGEQEKQGSPEQLAYFLHANSLASLAIARECGTRTGCL